MKEKTDGLLQWQWNIPLSQGNSTVDILSLRESRNADLLMKLVKIT